MRKVGLNTATAKEALEILVKGELLEQVSEPTMGVFEFEITEKGKAALTQYYQLITYFFKPKQKNRSTQYLILPLLAQVARFIFGQFCLLQVHSPLSGGPLRPQPYLKG